MPIDGTALGSCVFYLMFPSFRTKRNQETFRIGTKHLRQLIRLVKWVLRVHNRHTGAGSIFLMVHCVFQL